MIHLVQDYFIGIDVGTGSARACLIDSTGDIKALASEAIKLWQPQTGYYVRRQEPSTAPKEGTMATDTCISPGTIHNRHLGLYLLLRAQSRQPIQC